MRDGQAGQAETCLQGLNGSERPEAGCLGEIGTWVWGNSHSSIGFG